MRAVAGCALSRAVKLQPATNLFRREIIGKWISLINPAAARVEASGPADAYVERLAYRAGSRGNSFSTVEI
jgi:hypothetical protein